MLLHRARRWQGRLGAGYQVGLVGLVALANLEPRVKELVSLLGLGLAVLPPPLWTLATGETRSGKNQRASHQRAVERTLARLRYPSRQRGTGRESTGSRYTRLPNFRDGRRRLGIGK